MVMQKTLDEISTLNEKLYDSLSAALENIAFVTVERCDGTKGYDKCGGEDINGSILIKTAPAIYSLELSFQQVFLEKISADITVPGTQSESEGNIVIDILLELVNTVSGSLMREMEPITGTFTLEIPEFEIGNSLHSGAFITERYIIDDNYPITLAIRKI
jgi:hypothetical protein